jgi:Zn-dependent alcohol dehydrogenase
VQQGGRDQQVEAAAVGPPAAALDLEAGLGALGRGGPAEVGQDRVVAWLGQVGDGAVQQLGLGAAEQVAEGAVDPQEAAVQADQGHPDGRLVEAEAEVQSAPPSLSPAGEPAHVPGQPRPTVSDE